MPRKAHPAGLAGEKLAADFLKKSGYRILQRNYTCSAGEIDLIVLDGDEIAFVEVKSGSTEEFVAPEKRVNLAKQRRISRVALDYCRRKRLQQVNCRFDVVSVLRPPDGEPRLNLFKCAFPLRAFPP